MGGIISLITGLLTLGGTITYLESVFKGNTDYSALFIALLGFAGFIQFVILSAYDQSNRYEHNKEKMNINNSVSISEKMLKDAQSKWWKIFAIAAISLIAIGFLGKIL